MHRTTTVNLTRLICLCAFAVVVPTATSVSGEITGTVAGPAQDGENSRVVVWVEGAPAPATPPANAVVSQKGIQFVPQLLIVTEGQTIDMPNDDNVAHNVFSMSPTKQFKLGIYPTGQSRSVTFEKAGVIDLFCSIHRHMHAVIIVTPSGHYAETEVGKGYKVADLPDGEYTVKAWNPALGVTEVSSVTVTGGAAECDITLEDNS